MDVQERKKQKKSNKGQLRGLNITLEDLVKDLLMEPLKLSRWIGKYRFNLTIKTKVDIVTLKYVDTNTYINTYNDKFTYLLVANTSKQTCQI